MNYKCSIMLGGGQSIQIMRSNQPIDYEIQLYKILITMNTVIEQLAPIVQFLGNYNIQQMQVEFDPKKFNCIEVIGINNLAAAYIKRFFSHAGEVMDITKDNDRVIVRFKYPSSVNKACRYNGRVLEKTPMKIRHLSASTPLEQVPQKKVQKSYNNIRKFNEEISERIKDGPLDLPYHWAKVERILRNFEDDELRWLIYELFIEKVEQIFILYLTGYNSRSRYHEYVLIEMILMHKKKQKPISSGQNSSTQKLEYTALLPYDLECNKMLDIDQSVFETWNSKIQIRLRNRFLSLRQEGEGMTLFYLYQLFYKNSLKLQEGLKLFSEKQESSENDKEKSKRITFSELSKLRAQVCIQDWVLKFSERSQYRDIDVQHPSKEIQIFSDSYFHDGPSSAVVFQIFIDTFDGNISNPYAINIFHDFREFLAPNCLLIRHTDSRKNSYQRLFFNLRIINCIEEVFEEKQYMQLWTIKTDFEKLEHIGQGYKGIEEQGGNLIVNERLVRVLSVKMQRHNLVVGYWVNMEQIIYNVEAYLDYYCGYNESETESEYCRSLAVFIICTNTNPKQTAKVDSLIMQWKSRQKIMKSNTILNFIFIENQQKFYKEKIRHYLEDQIDNILKSPLNIDIAQMRAKQFLLESPQKFQCIEDAEKFITNTIWQLYQQKGKKDIKRQIMEYSFKIRS